MSLAKNESSAVVPVHGFSNRTVVVIVGLLLAIQTALLVHSAKVHSPTWDEVGHLAAGLSHWELGRFELYSVNPPLVRTLAAAPVALIAKPEVDWTFYRTAPQVRSEVFVGRQFIEQHGEKSFDYFFYARLAVIPISLLGALLCFLWARDLFGVGAGLVAMTIWCFEPNVLAYGSVITPDLGAAVAMLGASYVFYRWLIEPTWSWALMLASVTALAMLTKSVWLMLPAIYFAIFVLHHCRAIVPIAPAPEANHESHSSFKLSLTQLALACLLALVLTNGFYGFTNTLTPLGDFKFVSTAFSGNEPCLDCGTDSRPTDPASGNRFASSFLGKLPVPLPANYLQGIDIQTRDFERGFYDAGWQSYLLGNWQQGGWSYYYVIAMLVKIPLALWLLVGVGSVMAIFWRPDRQAFLGVVCLWLPAVLMFVLVSFNTGLNRYMRYALPVLPVLFIWAAQSGRWIETAFVHWSTSRSSRTSGSALTSGSPRPGNPGRGAGEKGLYALISPSLQSPLSSVSPWSSPRFAPHRTTSATSTRSPVAPPRVTNSCATATSTGDRI